MRGLPHIAQKISHDETSSTKHAPRQTSQASGSVKFHLKSLSSDIISVACTYRVCGLRVETETPLSESIMRSQRARVPRRTPRVPWLFILIRGTTVALPPLSPGPLSISITRLTHPTGHHLYPGLVAMFPRSQLLTRRVPTCALRLKAPPPRAALASTWAKVQQGPVPPASSLTL
jgi:hypothetical protein